jgi:hypothetical protein
MIKKKPVHIENWSLVRLDPFQAPEHSTAYLQGNVYGHPDFKDGKEVISSAVLTIDLTAGLALTQSGTEYTLGAMDPDFQNWYEDFKEKYYG